MDRFGPYLKVAQSILKPPILNFKSDDASISNMDPSGVFSKTLDSRFIISEAAKYGCQRFVVSISNKIGTGLPRNKPKSLGSEINKLIPDHKSIDNLKFTRDNKIEITTSNPICAEQVCAITNLLGLAVVTSLQLDNLTTKFLLRDIPTDINLNEVAFEIEECNDIYVTEIRRFTKQQDNSRVPSETVLVSVLGVNLPSKIKIWYTIQNITTFVDRPRQCRRCFLYNHTTKKCTKDPVCLRCGSSPEVSCTQPLRCVLCNGPHAADYKECPKRIEETEFLKFKCLNHFSFAEARRLFKPKATGTTTASIVTKSLSDETSTLKPEVIRLIKETVQSSLIDFSSTFATLQAQQSKTTDVLNSLSTQVSQIATCLASVLPSLSAFPATLTQATPRKRKELTNTTLQSKKPGHINPNSANFSLSTTSNSTQQIPKVCCETNKTSRITAKSTKIEESEEMETALTTEVSNLPSLNRHT